MFKIQSNPLNTDTSLLRTVFLCPWGKKALTFSLHSTHLKRTPIKEDNGHFFLAQSTNFHRKSTSLERTLHYQLWAVVDLSFLMAWKKFSWQHVDFPSALQYTGYDDLYTSISLIILAPNEFSRELILKCFREFGRRNDGFVMARDV